MTDSRQQDYEKVVEGIFAKFCARVHDHKGSSWLHFGDDLGFRIQIWGN